MLHVYNSAIVTQVSMVSKRKGKTSGQPDLCTVTINIRSRCCPSKLRKGNGETWMNDLIWAGIWAMFLKNAVEIAQVMGIALAWLIFALMCVAQLGKLYDWIKQECDLERLLDTPQKREDTKLEGTTFDFPEPEEGKRRDKMCPTCGQKYPATRARRCQYDDDCLIMDLANFPLDLNKAELEEIIDRKLSNHVADDLFDIIDEHGVDAIRHWEYIRTQCITGQDPEWRTKGPIDPQFAAIPTVNAMKMLLDVLFPSSPIAKDEDAA